MSVEALPAAPPWRVAGGVVVVRVRLTPKGGCDAIDGTTSASQEPALAARVRAVPEKGAANAALEALVARTLGIRKSDVAVTGGHTSRIKSISITGEPAVILAKLEALASAPIQSSRTSSGA